jgi:YD repeat-containing protein
LVFGSRRLRGDRLGFWRLQFDATSRKTLRIDGRALRTSYSYDAAGRLTGQQYQDGTRVTNIYDAYSQRTVLSDLTGSYTSTYDPDGRISSVINPAGIATHVILG